MYLVVTKAILRLGRDRLSDILQLEMSVSLKKTIVVNASQKSFAKLSTEFLCKMLRAEDTDLRKLICLKCLIVFKKPRLRIILRDYVAAPESYYYNVIHWLDFGISMATQMVVSAARQQALSMA
jgi:hypothetical protein